MAFISSGLSCSGVARVSHGCPSIQSLNAGVVRRFGEVCVGEKGVILMYLEIGRSSPGAVASNADDGTLVDVTAADEAVVRRIVSIRSVFAPTERNRGWCLFVVAGYWKYVP